MYCKQQNLGWVPVAMAVVGAAQGHRAKRKAKKEAARAEAQLKQDEIAAATATATSESAKIFGLAPWVLYTVGGGIFVVTLAVILLMGKKNV